MTLTKLTATLFAAGALVIAGCDGSDGAAGPAGATGATGAAGPSGSNGVTSITLDLLGRYESGIFDESAAEIVAHDATNQLVFQVNANSGNVDVIDIMSPATPVLVRTIDVADAVATNTTITTVLDAVNSVAVSGDIAAAAIAADAVDERGVVAFFNTADGAFIGAVEVGFLPDSIAISPDGSTAVVANEGEPNDDYTVDPEGSISIIDIGTNGAAAATAQELTFTDFNTGGTRESEIDPAVRIYGPGATVAQDLEPEFVAFSSDSQTAFVSLQENNALAVVDIATSAITTILALGSKDHSLLGNEFDASDRDDAIRLQNWPTRGFYMPDTIATYQFQGETLIVTANEGDTRDYDGYSEEERIGDLTLDPTAFPDAASLQDNANLGRLLTTIANGDTDNDGDYDELYSIGTRSFTIWNTSGEILFDSGNDFERITASRLPNNFNANNDDNEGDSRSDAKGPEPEALAIGEIGGATFAFIGLERVSGIMVYNLSNPQSPRFVEYALDRNFNEAPSLGDTNADGIDESNGAAGDLGPESIAFVAAADSPNGNPLLIVGSEVSGTTAIYQINTVEE